MSGVIESAVAKAGAVIVEKAVKNVGEEFSKNAGPQARRLLDKILAAYEVGFTDFLQMSYLRCNQIKTLVSGDRPIPLMDLYVNLSLTCAEIHLADDDLIKDLKSYKHVVITGLAGAGKSMLMKYLTVCRFENSQGNIPIFVELRGVNSSSSIDLIKHIHSTCCSASSRVTLRQFQYGLEAGSFLLVLDGFDEVEDRHRDEVSKQIRSIAERYSKTIIVVSSRPDDRFRTWASFFVFGVDKLTIKQTKKLIGNLDFDEGVKSRFISQIDGALHKTHASFLAIPLLATMMLLTFRRVAEIAPKIHLFYRQAFETLFREHDALKDQFIRKLYTNLAFDDFENCFAAFCTASYLEHKFSFNQRQAEAYADRGIKRCKLSVTPNSFVKDLVETVCMLQQDGVELTFVHRSFQEYFAALYASKYRGKDIKLLFENIAKRRSDNTLMMLFDINQELLEDVFILNECRRFLKLIREAMKKGGLSSALAVFYYGISYGDHSSPDSPDREIGIAISRNSLNASSLDSLVELYDRGYNGVSGEFFAIFDIYSIRSALVKCGLQGEERYVGFFNDNVDGIDFDLEFSSQDEVWLECIGADKIPAKIIAKLDEIRVSILGRKKQRVLDQENKRFV